MTQLSGIIPPVPTPFTPQGDVDLEALAGLLASLAPEVDGFLLLGSNGEAAFLNEQERREVVRAAREVVPEGMPLIVGTGGEATREVQQRNEDAAAAGASAVLVLPPHYFQRAMSERLLAVHYRSVAAASPLPVLLYNIPAATTLSLSPGLVAELAAEANIVGLKDSSGNVPALTEIMRRVPADFMVFTGNAPTLLPALSLGAAGGILAVANVAARAYRALFDAFRAGRLERARELQLRLNPLALAVTTGYGVPGLKAALRLQGRPAGFPRAPLQDVSAEATAELQALLASALD
ncbi:MAG TPA: dihydrodipicolinate synthase family protein [Trueperaceae bacterium]